MQHVVYMPNSSMEGLTLSLCVLIIRDNDENGRVISSLCPIICRDNDEIGGNLIKSEQTCHIDRNHRGFTVFPQILGIDKVPAADATGVFPTELVKRFMLVVSGGLYFQWP